jgi:hypothetical protein
MVRSNTDSTTELLGDYGLGVMSFLSGLKVVPQKLYRIGSVHNITHSRNGFRIEHE